MAEISLDGITNPKGQLNIIPVRNENYYIGHLTKDARKKLRELLKLYDKNKDNALSENEQKNVEIYKMEEIVFSKNLAQDTNTTADVLAILAQHPDKNVKLAVIEHVRVTPKILSKLSTDESVKVRGAVAIHPKTGKDTLAKLSGDKDEWVRGAVAENTNTPPPILAELVFDDEENVRYAAAGNYNTPPEALEYLVLEDYSHWVKEAIAKNPNVTRGILDILADPNYGGEKTRIAVALNRETSHKAIERLSKDKSVKVRLAVVSSPNGCVDSYLLEKMVYGDRDPRVRKAARARLNKK